MISSGGKGSLRLRTVCCPRVGVGTLRGVEMQHTHQVYFESGEAGQLLRVKGRLQGVARGAALVDVEQGVPLAPSPGSSSSTRKRKFPLEPDA